MYKLLFTLFIMPIYCIITFDSFVSEDFIIFTLFIVTLFFNSFVIYKPKCNRFDKFIYCLDCLVIFPSGYFLYTGYNSLIIYSLFVIALNLLFFTKVFFEINVEILYLLLAGFTLFFGFNYLYINVKFNVLVCFVFTGILHFASFPISKKCKVIKYVNKTSRKKSRNE